MDHGDQAQLIFESLNSTGLALTEGDKIRNYVLMGLPAEKQKIYYTKYWLKIEECTGKDLSGFVRDYLSIKQMVAPTINTVYRNFNEYAERGTFTIEELLTDLLRYARLFQKLGSCQSGTGLQELDDCLYRLKRLEITVTRPFLMQVLRLAQDERISSKDLLQIFLITESYLFRRSICDIPANALNKIFVHLNREIIRYDNTTNQYLEKFIYALQSKRESGRFPDDNEFAEAISTKQIYLMRGKYKAYLFERFENFGTVETNDVYTHLDQNVYSIEHIMPQTLTPSWVEALGENAQEIHENWKHRLANLTLSGYNSKLSNASFLEKRDTPEGGYKTSGLRMNQRIAGKDKWGAQELEERDTEMKSLATKIWSYPETTFHPVEREFKTCTLADEDVDLTGIKIIKYSFQGLERPVSSWSQLFEQIVKFLYEKNKFLFTQLVYGNGDGTHLSTFIKNDPKELRVPFQIDTHIHIEKNTSTSMKILILRKLFAYCKEDPTNLVFYLKETIQPYHPDGERYKIRERYWSYALPLIKSETAQQGYFTTSVPTTSNIIFGSFGINGCEIHCVANYNDSRIDFLIDTVNEKRNKRLFDQLHNQQEEIEKHLGISLIWNRNNNCRCSLISYTLPQIGLSDESEWPTIAKSHAKWSGKICEALLLYLKKKSLSYSKGNGISLHIKKPLLLFDYFKGRTEVFLFEKNQI